MKFPTVEWFQALEEQATQRAETFRRLGFCDATVGIKVLAEGELAKERSFVSPSMATDARWCRRCRTEKVADFVLEGKYGVWKEMIENIRNNRGPDLRHTLNYLTLPGDPIRINAQDQLKQDLFFRYNGTLQEFFNGAQQVKTEFF